MLLTQALHLTADFPSAQICCRQGSPMWILSSLYPSPSLNTTFVNLKSNQEVAFLCLPSSWTFSVTRSSQSTQQICDGSDHWALLSAILQVAHLAVMSSNLITLDLDSLRIKSLRKETARVWNFLDSQAEKVCVPRCSPSSSFQGSYPCTHAIPTSC